MGAASTERVNDLAKKIGEDIAEIHNKMIQVDEILLGTDAFIQKLWEGETIPVGLPVNLSKTYQRQ